MARSLAAFEVQPVVIADACPMMMMSTTMNLGRRPTTALRRAEISNAIHLLGVQRMLLPRQMVADKVG